MGAGGAGIDGLHRTGAVGFERQRQGISKKIAVCACCRYISNTFIFEIVICKVQPTPVLKA
jgi:hypothetical protein